MDMRGPFTTKTVLLIKRELSFRKWVQQNKQERLSVLQVMKDKNEPKVKAEKRLWEENLPGSQTKQYLALIGTLLRFP